MYITTKVSSDNAALSLLHFPICSHTFILQPISTRRHHLSDACHIKLFTTTRPSIVPLLPKFHANNQYSNYHVYTIVDTSVFQKYQLILNSNTFLFKHLCDSSLKIPNIFNRSLLLEKYCLTLSAFSPIPSTV